MGAFSRKLLLLSALVTCFAVGMACLLFYFKFESTLSKIQRTRLIYIANEIQDVVEQSLALGLSLPELSTLPSMIDRQKSADTLITGIDVIEESGRILYSTDKPRVGTIAPKGWAEAMVRSQNEWSTIDPVTGLAVRNSFNVKVASVAIRYDGKPLRESVKRLGLDLLVLFAVVSTAFTLLLFAALMFFFRRFENHLHEGAVALSEKAGDAHGRLAHELLGARVRISEAHAALRQAEQALKGAQQ